MRNILFLTVLTAGLLPFGLEGGAILTVDPGDGVIAVGPGETSGWGFHVQDNGGFVVLTASFFIPDSPFGDYIDFVSLPQNFYLLTPFATLDVPFDSGTQQGLGQFTALQSDLPGAEIDGTIFLLYDLYSSDPRTNPVLVEGGLSTTADVSIQVASPAAEVREPAPFVLVGTALLAVIGVRLYGRRLSSEGPIHSE